jgi:hypothetical protein
MIQKPGNTWLPENREVDTNGKEMRYKQEKSEVENKKSGL